MQIRNLYMAIRLGLAVQPASYCFQDSGSGQLATIFEELRHTTDAESRRKIVETTPRLMDINVPKDIVAIQSALDDGDPYIRFRAARLVVALALLRPNVRAELKPVLPLIRQHVADSYQEWHRAWVQTVLEAVSLLDTEPSAANLKLTRDYLYDSDEATSRDAVQALGRLRPCVDPCANALVSKMGDKADPGSALTVLDAVGRNRIDNPAVLEAVNERLVNGSKAEKLAAAKTLGQVGSPAARYRSVLERLATEDSADADLRRAAAAALLAVK